MKQDFYERLTKIVSEDRVKVNEPMNRHTTFRTGGPADYFVAPETKEELKELISVLKEIREPYYIIGNGSNLLVRDRWNKRNSSKA